MQARGEIYKVAEQLVLLYGSKIWVVTGEILKVLEGFQHRAARRITGMSDKRGAGGEWEYPLVVEAMEAAGIQPIGLYIRRQQATIVVRLACHLLYKLCTEAERMLGTSRLV